MLLPRTTGGRSKDRFFICRIGSPTGWGFGGDWGGLRVVGLDSIFGRASAPPELLRAAPRSSSSETGGALGSGDRDGVFLRVPATVRVVAEPWRGASRTFGAGSAITGFCVIAGGAGVCVGAVAAA